VRHIGDDLYAQRSRELSLIEANSASLKEDGMSIDISSFTTGGYRLSLAKRRKSIFGHPRL